MAMVFQHFSEATNHCPHCGYDAGGAIDWEIEWFVFYYTPSLVLMILTTFSNKCGITYCKVLNITKSEHSCVALEEHNVTFEPWFNSPKLTAMPPSLRKRKRDDGIVDNVSKFRRVRLQAWNVLPHITPDRPNLCYLDKLLKFHKQQGDNLRRFPSIDKRPLDLYKLKKAVEVRGGFHEVCNLKNWPMVGRDLGYSGKIMASLSTSLKKTYQKWVSPYEDFLRATKPGIYHQIDYENGAGHNT